MKRKSVATSRTSYADILNKLDGLRAGISRSEFRKALKLMETLEAALIKRGYKSAVLIIRRNAKKKAAKL